MFTELYLNTTNPELPLSKLVSIPLLISVIFHTILYSAFFNLVSYIFLGRLLSITVNARLITALILIMFFGFFARFFHVKEIYNAYGKNLEKTRNHMDKLYITWIFIS
jgi:hypothetical protein